MKCDIFVQYSIKKRMVDAINCMNLEITVREENNHKRPHAV